MTAEQEARNLLERMGVSNAQEYTSGDLVELANLIHDKQKAIAERDYAIMAAVRYLSDLLKGITNV